MTTKSRRKPEREFVLPLNWSLYYVMSRTEWENFRTCIRAHTHNWDRCPMCPENCLARHCDETWKYDDAGHIKQFVKAQFICPGCHWLKSPGARRATWQKQERGDWLPPEKTPHIYACLGWTKRRVNVLRKSDFESESRGQKALSKLAKAIAAGKVTVSPWKIELSALAQYGYSKRQVQKLEERMAFKASATLADAFTDGVFLHEGRVYVTADTARELV